ncbi:MAG: glycosyl transferase group 1 [Deltaproteobacteria bacterium]|nr:glycosyl transferase group 1 [Deltaproteobacteria bacterium]
MERPLKICLDARLKSGGGWGGVEQFVIGMADGLSRLTDGQEEYLFLVEEGSHEWLAPFVGGPCRFLSPKKPAGKPRRPGRWIFRLFPSRDPYGHLADLAGGLTAKFPRSLGVVERAAVDIMHFTNQGAFLTAIPSIYHPHDLQHLHLPHFFTPRVRRERDARYRSFCRQARMVAVSSSWTRNDVIRQYGLPEGKVRVVPLAPLLSAYDIPGAKDLASARRKFSLPDAFLFYPAATWAHKNHVGLLEALASLKESHGLEVPAVFSGSLTEYFPEIRRRAEELGLSEQVRFLGFVTSLELQCLYRLCRCVVIPTRFEAASFPLWEAFLAGAPAACSNVTSLPEQAGDAALVFDPDDREGMADAVRRLWIEHPLRERLIRRGKENVCRFSWEKTARIFRAHYRRIAGAPLTEEDRALIEAPPVL